MVTQNPYKNRSLSRFILCIIVLLYTGITGSLSAQDHLWVKPDYSRVSEDVSVRIRVLHNDHLYDIPADSTTLTILVEAKHGRALVEPEMGSIRYIPDTDFFGLDSFQYSVCNVAGDCQSAVVTVTIYPVNDAPVARGDQDTVMEDTWTYVDVTHNDFDPDNQREAYEQVRIIEMPKHGQLHSQQNRLRYEPAPDYYGNDYFRYAICDEALCDTATARIHVQPVNDRLKTVNDHYVTYAGLLVIMDVMANDDDSLDFLLPDYASLSITDLLLPEHGFIYLDSVVGLIVYQPDPDFIGIDSFQYQLCDFGPDPVLCDTATVVIMVNPGPNDSQDFTEAEGLVTPQSYPPGQVTRFLSTQLLQKCLYDLSRRFPIVKPANQVVDNLGIIRILENTID